jgi:hypothetical protein
MEIGAGNINGTFHIFDGATGNLEWNFQVGATPSDAVSCDIDSDGLGEFLFGTSDGRLISLGAEGVEWAMVFEEMTGVPIIADLDGDTKADILVPVMDGRLYALHIPESPLVPLLGLGILIIWKRRPRRRGLFHLFQRKHK